METALIAETISQYQRHETDKGSEEIQVALLTGRITQLTAHLKLHKKDLHSRRGLMRMVSRRRKLLDYIKRKNNVRYISLIQSLGLRR